MLNPFVWLVYNLLNLYFWVVIASVAMSWLVGFGIINGANPYVRQIWRAVNKLTDPLLSPIRSVLPDLGGIDISPIFLLIGIQFLQYLLLYYVAPLM